MYNLQRLKFTCSVFILMQLCNNHHKMHRPIHIHYYTLTEFLSRLCFVCSYDWPGIHFVDESDLKSMVVLLPHLMNAWIIGVCHRVCLFLPLEIVKPPLKLECTTVLDPSRVLQCCPLSSNSLMSNPCQLFYVSCSCSLSLPIHCIDRTIRLGSF